MYSVAPVQNVEYDYVRACTTCCSVAVTTPWNPGHGVRRLALLWHSALRAKPSSTSHIHKQYLPQKQYCVSLKLYKFALTTPISMMGEFYTTLTVWSI